MSNWVFSGLLGAVLAGASGASAQKPVLRMPPVAGMSLVQTLATPQGDRESVHTVAEVTSKGLRWTWGLIEVSPAGDTVRQMFRYAELHPDIATAIRYRAYHEADAPEEHPGYTMHSLSRALYQRLRAAGSDTFQIMAIKVRRGMFAGLGLGTKATPIRWRGTLSVATAAPVSFPVLVNGQRTEVPALHLRGRLTARGETWEPQLWILADSAYPLLLKWIGAHGENDNLLQTVRIDLPTGAVRELERGMTSDCRAELPGIYFGFNSAVLEEASSRTIADVAALLEKHPDWSVTLEGHTDSIGSAAANRTLSERRVAAVRTQLVSRHRVDGARIRSAGFGSDRPREPNTTVEGRARNRRVELVRECARR